MDVGTAYERECMCVFGMDQWVGVCVDWRDAFVCVRACVRTRMRTCMSIRMG